MFGRCLRIILDLKMSSNGVSCVDTTLNRSFYKLGKIIGRNPSFFIIIPIFLTIIFITGYQQLKYQIDPEYLFSPQNGAGKHERAIVEEYFKVNYSKSFSVERITRAGRFGRLIITTKDGDRNLIRPEIFQELRTLDGLIHNATATYDDEIYRYEDICARSLGDCFENDILNLDEIINDIVSGNMSLTFPIMFNEKTFDYHILPVFFGGTTVSPEGTVVSVPALQLVYFVAVDTPRQLAKGGEWEETFLRTIGDIEDSGFFKHIRIARFASRTLDHELEKNTRTVVPYYTLTFLLMLVFSVITCMMFDCVRSKPWLGFFGNLSAIMATLAAFGFCMYLGIEFIGLNLAAPFVMIAIGIDDTFVMLAAWRRTSIKLSVPERMGITMSDAAVSITITSLTDIISFWIGIMSPFPSIQIFCKYSGMTVCFIFFWHITFFAGCMALSGYSEQKNHHSIFGYKVTPLSAAIKENRSWLYRTFNTGGINPNDPDNPIDNKDHAGMAFFKDVVANIVNNGYMKMVILLIFAAYLFGAGYGITQIKEGLERRKLSKEDSYSVKFFDLEDEFYREFPYRMQVIVAGELNYFDPQVQEEYEKLARELESTSYVSGSAYSSNWLRVFLDVHPNITSEEDFMEKLREWMFPGSEYYLDVKFNANKTKVIATRFLIQALNITDTNHEKVMVKDLRKIVHDSSLNASIFHPYFVFFDQYELIRPTSVQSLIVGAAIMMLISFIFIPNILCSIWVAFSIVSIEMGVAGYMALWDVNLDSISMINLIMCIGYSIDFTAHICYSYMTSKSNNSDDRVREALHSLGMPIFQGAVSTILGCYALLCADSYIFLVFFKMIFLVISFGALHGIFLLPVLLSLFGPVSCNKDPTNERQLDNLGGDMGRERLSSIEKAYPHPYCIPHPQLGLQGMFNSKSYLNSPFKTYGIDEKDQGIGTSGEDSSESSSNKSQQRQAIEDENTRRRYEMSWKIPSEMNGSQFQPVVNMYGRNPAMTGRIYSYDDSNIMPKRRSSNDRETEQRPSTKNCLNDEPIQHETSMLYDSRRYYSDGRRRSLFEPNKRKISDESTPRRRHTPPEGIYRPNPNRYSSQHNLYYNRSTPQRSYSNHSINELRHMGDIRFP
ncbi:patched domain-containing protein 3 isoform X2 [Contarinia nasturtii]|uniref:patched domain-containing protein 3 isoform X2 n=1 Tax=Contarinia nasturtii TaxID=265458 RepID=UPI0012D38F12|nr:patched domain-containing protein 3 isoform X2 [Contarinia nasturtii]